MDKCVIFDLETIPDKADPREHQVIEIGAVLASGEAVLDRFQTLVHPRRLLEEHSRQLGGTTEARLSQAPHLRDALRDFCRFAGNRPLIAHNGFGYDFLLLDAASSKVGIIPPSTLRLDTLELAHVAFPRAGSGMVRHVTKERPPRGRSLDDLAHICFGKPPRETHRALDDARLTHRVLTAMISRLNQDEPVLNLQRWILRAGGHPWSKFLRIQVHRVSLEDVIPAPAVHRRQPATETFNISALTKMFEDGGVLMQGGRTPREQQIEMASLCAKALCGENGPALTKGAMIEAPTGTGKTLAYLAPAIEFARAAGKTVVVAPHSRVLQNQILATLEEMEETLASFSYVLLKGKHNYISLDSLAGELDALETQSEIPTSLSGAPDPQPKPVSPDASKALALAIICGWAALTPTGDWDDLRTWALERHVPELRWLRHYLRVEDVSPDSGSHLDRLDFYRRARHGFANAHVAIYNHALLAVSDDWIGEAKHLIVDEAHNFEESVTNALSKEASEEELMNLCSALWDPVRRRGVAYRIAAATGESLRSGNLKDLRKATSAATKAIQALGSPLVNYLRNRTGVKQEEAARYPMSYRIRPGVDTRRTDYREVRRLGKSLLDSLLNITEVLNKVDIPDKLRGRYRRRRLEAEVARLGRQIREAVVVIARVLSARDSESWINIGEVQFAAGRWQWKLRQAPLSVDGHLRSLWRSLDSFVLTSATLRVKGGFGHILSTLGLDAVPTTALGNPFPRLSDKHLVLLTDYLPSPRHRWMEEFRNSAASEIPRLFTLSRGRAMTLMTARARMEFVRDHARPILEREGLPLLTQGEAPSPALVERMRSEPATSLLALRSFWEGVDIPGEALSLLAIEKTPFDSPADPIVSARMETIERAGRDPFADYMVPRAALRFAQGAGRLIRSVDDRGVTVVLDNRLCRPTPYRDHILGTLPGPPTKEQVKTPEEAYQRIADHLGDVTYDEDMRKRLGAIPSAGPWAHLEELQLTKEESLNETIVRKRLEQVRERFGFAEWRPGQLETMLRYIRGEDVLAVLPTGSGKSITFQIPGLLSPGVTLVISPLTALMNDQTENLRSRRVTQAATIHSGISQSEQSEILRGAQSGRYKILYVSPERLWSPVFLNEARHIDFARVAIDEAHCISQWGHSFRTEYATIPRALQQMGRDHLPKLAVTATATPKVRQEIVELLSLNLQEAPVVRSPDRPEIRYYVEQCTDFKDRDVRVAQVLEAFRRQSAIVYAPKRADTTRLAGLLRSAGHVVRPYHGAMAQTERQHIEDAFRHGEIDVVVATKAFGMGIDKPDIALVLHLEAPASIEEYIQETGRVARGALDGVGPSTGAAVLFSTPGDCRIHRYFRQTATPDIDKVKKFWCGLSPGRNLVDPDKLSCQIGKEGSDNRQELALAVSYLEKQGLLRRQPHVISQAKITTVADTPQMIEDLKRSNPDLAERARRIISVLDNTGSSEYEPEYWEKCLDRKAERIEADLLELRAADILGFSVFKYAWNIYREPGLEPDWEKLKQAAAERRRAVKSMSEQAKRLVEKHQCRRHFMLRYLGVESGEGCGGCDICVSLPRPWANSEVTKDALIESTPAQSVVLQMVKDTAGWPPSRRNLVRALTGETGQYPLPEQLDSHPLNGHLYLLGKNHVEKVIEDLLGEDRLIEEEVAFDQRTYQTLSLGSADWI